MPQHVRITDVAPRDGLQNEPGRIPLDQKLALVRALAASGVDEVEITSFVSPRWIPQLADAEQLLEALRADPLPSPPVLSVLVPNEKGLDRALAFHTPEFPLKAAFFTAASETFNQRNTNATIAESIERFRPLVPRALSAAMPIRFYVSCAIACPFEGPIAPRSVRTVVDRLLDLIPSAHRSSIDIDLGDTIGVAAPPDIDALLDHFEPHHIARTTLHLHDTFGRATQCVNAALSRGVRSFDGAVGGLGGCPYASTPTSRAPGNIDTERLVRTIHDAGYTTAINLESLRAATECARAIAAAARHAPPTEHTPQ